MDVDLLYFTVNGSVSNDANSVTYLEVLYTVCISRACQRCSNEEEYCWQQQSLQQSEMMMLSACFWRQIFSQTWVADLVLFRRAPNHLSNFKKHDILDNN